MDKQLLSDDDQSQKEMFKLIDYDLHVDEELGKDTHLRNIHPNSMTTLWPIHDFVERVIKTNQPGFEIQKKGDRAVGIKPLPLAFYFKSINRFWRKYQENIALYGLVGLFFECCVEVGLVGDHTTRPNQLHSLGKIEAEVFNDLLELMRTKAKSRKYRQLMAKLDRNVRRNFKSMMKYIDALFDEYSKLLVLRIDLGYHHVQSQPITSARILGDFQRLLNNRRSNALFADMVGYIRRLEYGSEKSWHLHVIIFYNGQDAQNASTLTRLIGEYWRDVITDHDGTYFNCNDSRNEYKYCGIGKISHWEAEKRTHLLYALTYLTKKDRIIGFDVPKKCKMMTKGEPPKPRPNKPGPKRRTS